MHARCFTDLPLGPSSCLRNCFMTQPARHCSSRLPNFRSTISRRPSRPSSSAMRARWFAPPERLPPSSNWGPAQPRRPCWFCAPRSTCIDAVRFIPVDVSSFALDVAYHRVRTELPQVAVQPLVMDYTQHSLALAPAVAQLPGRKLVLYIGSSIGNFEPMAASALLRRLRSSLAPGDSLLLGTDMRKPADMLLPAYDDASGVTAQFNLNILARINREFDADFDLDRFAHCVTWNERDSRIEMHLESRVRSLRQYQGVGDFGSICLGRDDSYREQLQVHTVDD